MLMRPLERPIFDHTRDWLHKNPKERFLLVIDEAHLYRGAAGTEVALLIRRLRMRLGIPAARLQVICTSASFADRDAARVFGAELTGKAEADFEVVSGTLRLREHAAPGSAADADLLAKLGLEVFHDAESDDARRAAVDGFLRARGVADAALPLHRALHAALAAF